MNQKMPSHGYIASSQHWLAPELPRVAEVTAGGHCHDLVDIKEGMQSQLTPQLFCKSDRSYLLSPSRKIWYFFIRILLTFFQPPFLPVSRRELQFDITVVCLPKKMQKPTPWKQFLHSSWLSTSTYHCASFRKIQKLVV